MARPDVNIPRRRWRAYFDRISGEACGRAVLVDEPAAPAAEAPVERMPLRHIAHDSDTDEIVIVAGSARAEAHRLRRLRRPVAVWADAPESRCPSMLVVRSDARPAAVIVLLEETEPALTG